VKKDYNEIIDFAHAAAGQSIGKAKGIVTTTLLAASFSKSIFTFGFSVFAFQADRSKV
jgi:hypothetical protein